MEEQFVVGGAVRDILLNRIPQDVDYVWTGSSDQAMADRGFSRVGASFPVFLDHAGQEHALARRERKTGVGYLGFQCDTIGVSIEDDLARRDLTINSLAVRAKDWDAFIRTKNIALVVDPWGGIADLHRGLLRHTSVAFSEDCVRVLRTARFAARYGFSVAAETVELMHRVVPELDLIPTERIFTEFEKGMSENDPHKMLEVLDACDASRAASMKPYMRMWLRRALLRVKPTTPMYVRFALLTSSFTDEDFEACKIPTEYSRVSKLVHKNFIQLVEFDRLSAEDAVAVLDKMRTFSDPELSERVFEVVKVYIEDTNNLDYWAWKLAVNKRVSNARSIDTAAIAASCASSKEIRAAIFAARVKALKS